MRARDTSTPRVAFPPPGAAWQPAEATAVGMDPQRLAAVADFCLQHETPRWPPEIVGPDGQYPNSGFGGTEWDALIGPVKPRTGPNGVVLRRGHLVAEWGDTARADMTFSISKSYLALLAGIAVGDGLIRSVHDTVRSYGLDDGYEAPQNRGITWHHLLNQTSEWEGALWGKPDLVDRNRVIGGGAADSGAKGEARPLQAPGTHWEYNDVRVNRLSHSLLLLFGRPLTEVLQERIMGPIGASADWEWPAYDNAWVELGGRRVPSIPGGGHWGGGLWVGSRDHARVGHLVLNDGVWDGRRLLPEGWCAALRTPATGNPAYGYLWWLNPGRQALPAASGRAMFGRGAGTHLLWVEPAHDLVVVSRWVDSEHWPELTRLVTEAVVN